MMEEFWSDWYTNIGKMFKAESSPNINDAPLMYLVFTWQDEVKPMNPTVKKLIIMHAANIYVEYSHIPPNNHCLSSAEYHLHTVIIWVLTL